jgi:hypothetical protein
MRHSYAATSHRTMRTPIGTRAFSVGFLAGLFLLIAVNVYGYNRMNEAECFDCIQSFGFPFRLYESGTILHLERILWYGLIADVLIAISVGAGIGLLFHFFKKVRGRRLS